MKNVLLIAGLDERYYYDPFLKGAANRDLRLHLLDPSYSPADTVIDLTLEYDGTLAGSVEVFSLGAGTAEQTYLNIRDIDVAWYLRGGRTGTATESMSLEERFRKNEARCALRSFFATLSCPWINHPEVVQFISSNKLYQQQIASRGGLTVPATLLGNDPRSIARFSEKHGGLLLKSIGYTTLDKEGRYCLYSQRIPHEEIIHSAIALRYCPVFSQEYVDKRYEYRVMVIGDRVLSCRIDSQASEKTRVDWRHYDFKNVAHTQVDLPQDLQEKLRAFMSAIGLKYGALDLIETPNGDFVFLEVNPSGQWGWIADLAGLPIPEAVVEMLASA